MKLFNKLKGVVTEVLTELVVWFFVVIGSCIMGIGFSAILLRELISSKCKT